MRSDATAAGAKSPRREARLVPTGRELADPGEATPQKIDGTEWEILREGHELFLVVGREHAALRRHQEDGVEVHGL